MGPKVLAALAFALTCLPPAGALAVPVIDVGVIEVQPDATRTFAIVTTGSGAVQGLDLYIQIGDGGAPNGGSDTRPIITAVDIVGPDTMFHASNTGQRNVYTSDLLWAVSTTTDSAVADELDANGIVAYVTINTTGTAEGESYPLLLTGVAEELFGEPGTDTTFAGVVAQITNGTIDIISEPATIALLCGAIGGLVLRKRP
jgi:hypothetical protein